MHIAIEPSILYFGTPVVLLSTENEDGTFNLAPLLGLGPRPHGGSRPRQRRAERAQPHPAPRSGDQPAVTRPVARRRTPRTAHRPPPRPPTKAAGCRYEPDKFGAAGLHPEPSDTVRPPRVAECPLQLEARAAQVRPDATGTFLVVEAQVRKVHADPALTVPGTDHINPAAWTPLIYNFRHYFGLGPELGHSYRTQTPATVVSGCS